jgi:hypothetical protein
VVDEMKVHPRYFIVSKAEVELSTFLLDLQQKHDLTYGELFKILAAMMASFAKYLIREERHPDDPEKKGDEE